MSPPATLIMWFQLRSPEPAEDFERYVLIAEIVEVERFEQQASEHVERLAEDLDHLVWSRGMLVVRPVV